MLHNSRKEKKQLTLVIHSTDNSFGFAYRKNNNTQTDTFFTKKFEKDLCNNLIVDFGNFISKDNLKNVDKISVSTGPANFNASRLIVVLARTISQQINCQIDSFSSFELMAKRIALKNNILEKHESFWIFKKLKRKGYIAGKYEVCISEDKSKDFKIIEKVIPNIYQQLFDKEPYFEANYNDQEDLKELLNLSNNNLEISNFNSWEKVRPLYPLTPVN